MENSRPFDYRTYYTESLVSSSICFRQRNSWQKATSDLDYMTCNQRHDTWRNLRGFIHSKSSAHAEKTYDNILEFCVQRYVNILATSHVTCNTV